VTIIDLAAYVLAGLFILAVLSWWGGRVDARRRHELALAQERNRSRPVVVPAEVIPGRELDRGDRW
jgi:hypothetical protein